MPALARFVEAQDRVFEDVLAELRDGRKRTHWMWFVFPQLAGLGRSSTAQHYAIADLAEARAYAAHPVLGDRLRTCVDLLGAHPDRSAREILGDVDALKLRSCLTLFAAAAPDEPRFAGELQRRFDGPDPRTLELLAAAP